MYPYQAEDDEAAGGPQETTAKGRKARRDLDVRAGKKRAAGWAKDLAGSPILDATGSMAMPFRAALTGAAVALEAPEEDVLEQGVLRQTAADVGSAVGTVADIVKTRVGRDVDAASTILFGKQEKRAAEREHAVATTANAREDPSAGTVQGASQDYRGTGDVTSKTGETGGVTTGAPGRAALRVGLPDGEMVDYDPSDPTVREAFAQQDDSFMEHSTRAAPTRPGQIRRPAGAAVEERGPESAAGHGGAMWTRSSVPEADQIANWDEYLKGRDAEQQLFHAGLAEAGAKEATAEAEAARAEILTEEPFYGERLEAEGRLSKAQIEAKTEIAERMDIKKIVEQAAVRIDELRLSPMYQQLDQAERERLEDQIWDQARLALSAISETNLYPRPDPYGWMTGMGGPTKPEEKTD